MSQMTEMLATLRKDGIVKGVRPVIIKILKSNNYAYKGRYLLTLEAECLNFYELKLGNRYKGAKARNFKIEFKALSNYHDEYFKSLYHKANLYFKDGLCFSFLYLVDCTDAYDNDGNIKLIYEALKQSGISKKQIKKEGPNDQKAISKRDQLFVKEIRCPEKRGR